MMKKWLLFILLISMNTNLIAGGDTGLAVLKIGAGARAAAMGEAFVALADDATALFWNPAGTSWMKNRQVHFTHTQWIQGITHNVASVSLPVGSSNIGIGLILNNVEGFEYREIASEEPLGTFSSQDIIASLNYSRRVSETFSMGLNVKYVHEKIYTQYADGYLADLGARYQPFSDMYFAVALQNLGVTSDMDAEQINIPEITRAGVLYKLPFSMLQDNVSVALDYIKLLDADSHVHLGTEFKPFSSLNIRLGYQTGYKDKSFSAGFGLNFGQLHLDYAYVPFGHDLGQSHRFSFLTAF
ncbi:MAG: PorV/PorQ family protein [candidate division KSB1 bacterium]|nr:PorV/PorQ family protein [candidate division KSB1 bacterium]